MTDSPVTADGYSVSQSRWVIALSVINACSLVSAFTLPWLLPKQSDGFAAAATAALLFLGAMGLALLSGIAALILAWRYRKTLPLKFAVLGFSLLPITLIAIALFFAYALMREGG